MKQQLNTTSSRVASTAAMERPVAIIPHENDILMGRGGKNNQHVGNERLRVIAQERRESYVLSDKQGKFYISRAIVVEIRRLDPPGRFLKRNDRTGEWEDVGDDKAREKVSQALRDAGRPVVAMKRGGRSPSSSPDIEGGGGGEGSGRGYDREVIPYTIASNSTSTRATSYMYNNDEYQRRANSAPTVVTSSRHQPHYAYTPAFSSAAGHQLHRHHHQHHHHYHQYYHHQQYRQQYASDEPASAFEPPPPRLRHYSPPPAVAPVVTYSSQDDIPRSPIIFSVAKKQKTEEDTSTLHPYVHMSAAPPPADAKGEDSAATSSAAAAAAAPEQEEEFDLFNGGLLQQDESRREVPRRSKRDYGEFQLSSNKTF